MPVFSCVSLCQTLNVWAEIFHARCLPQAEIFQEVSSKMVQLFLRMRLKKRCCLAILKKYWRLFPGEVQVFLRIKQKFEVWGDRKVERGKLPCHQYCVSA